MPIRFIASPCRHGSRNGNTMASRVCMINRAVVDQANSPPDEQALAQQYIKEEPRSLKAVVERFAHQTEKRLSISTLKRLAKKARLRWKRVRKSLKSLRDPKAFDRCQRE